MSFGKRQRERKGQGAPEASGNTDVIHREPSGASDDDDISVMPILIGLGGIAGIVALAFGGRAVLGELLVGHLKHGPTRPAVTEHYAKLADICSPGSEENNNLVSRLQSDLEGVQNRVRKPHFLNCMMLRHQERFCNSSERTAIARDLSAYFHYYESQNEKVRFAEEFRRNNPNNLFLQINEMNKERGRITGGAALKEVDTSVVSNMQQLVRDGYLSANDFGWSLPTYMEPYFVDVKREKESC